MQALGIDVSRALLNRWVGWFAPDPQPFLVDADLAGRMSRERSVAPLPDELRDTYEVYRMPEHAGVVWLEHAGFDNLPRDLRTALVRTQQRYEREQVPSVRSWVGLIGDEVRWQADGHRFVWWPGLLVGHEVEVLTAYVDHGRRPSRHGEVAASTWRRAERRLPSARALAGTFAPRSGPNCFGTVMAAAGMVGAADAWMLREPFEEWLRTSTRSGGTDDDVGTVLVWRSPEGQVEHAAVTLGDGWALHKPSQGWMSPRKVLTVDQVKRSARAPGRHLSRHHLAAAV